MTYNLTLFDRVTWELHGLFYKGDDRKRGAMMSRSFERVLWYLIEQDGKRWAYFPHLASDAKLNRTLFRVKYWPKKKRWVIAGSIRTMLEVGPPGGVVPFQIMGRRAVWIVWSNRGAFARNRKV